MTTSSGHAKPLALQPSEYWDGADGNWSTFPMRVGTPRQLIRVLPSTAGRDLWAVSPQGCPPEELGTGRSTTVSCSQSRGGLFDPTTSTSWSNVGDFQTELELNFGYNDSANYGLDTIAFGLSNATKGPSLQSQLVGAFANLDFYTGMLGLGQQPTNLSNYDNSHSSLLTSLKDENIIPSLSWGYTAGARYQSTGIFGSLTFGGYDQSRVIDNNVSFHLAQDVTRDLVVSLRAITVEYSDKSLVPLLTTPILAFIDSTIPYIYMPTDVCQNFERAFNISWNATLGLYPVDDNLHSSLMRTDPNVTFTLEGEGSTIDISLPYASFDLTAEYPLVSNSTRYFPLMRADNDTQYTLGRTFLQEAYVATNYEYSNFSVYQSKFDPKLKQHLVALPSTTKHSTKPSTNFGARLGAGLGSGLFILVLAVIVIIMRKKRSQRPSPQLVSDTIPNSRTSRRRESPVNSMPREIDMNSLIGLYRELPDTGLSEMSNAAAPSGSVNNEPRPPRRELPSQLAIHELMTRRSSTLGSIPQESNVRHDSGIVVSTEISRRSSASETELSRVPHVMTAISSSSVNLNRSLPPTPISDSPKISPGVTALFRERRDIRAYTSMLRDSPIVGSVYGSIAENGDPDFSSNSTTKESCKHAVLCLNEQPSRMEITIPPEFPRYLGLEVVQPLKVSQKVGKRKRNIF